MSSETLLKLIVAVVKVSSIVVFKHLPLHHDQQPLVGRFLNSLDEVGVGNVFPAACCVDEVQVRKDGDHPVQELWVDDGRRLLQVELLKIRKRFFRLRHLEVEAGGQPFAAVKQKKPRFLCFPMQTF